MRHETDLHPKTHIVTLLLLLLLLLRCSEEGGSRSDSETGDLRMSS